jgi:hypothetical protein
MTNPTTSTHKIDIERAAADAVKIISDAAAVASKGVASAAFDAAKVVAEAAAVSVKVLSVKNADDHDLLIELKTLMGVLKDDIKDLKTGVSVQLADHESRVKRLETKTANYFITITLYSLAIAGIISAFMIHVLK